MPFIADLWKGGMWPLQDPSFFFDDFPIELRASRWAIRISGRHENEKEIGHYKFEQESVGDVIGGYLWHRNPAGEERSTPAWRFSWPVRTRVQGARQTVTGQEAQSGAFFVFPEGFTLGGEIQTGGGGGGGASGAFFTFPEGTIGGSGGTGGGSGSSANIAPFAYEREGDCKWPEVKVIPIFDAACEGDETFFVKDTRFREVAPFFMENWPKIPGDFLGLLLDADVEAGQTPVYMHTDPRLVAVHQEKDKADPLCSSLVVDLDNKSAVDEERMARLNSIFRVIKEPDGDMLNVDFFDWPNLETDGKKENSIAWNIMPSGHQDVRGGLVIDREVGGGGDTPTSGGSSNGGTATQGGGGGAAGAGAAAGAAAAAAGGGAGMTTTGTTSELDISGCVQADIAQSGESVSIGMASCFESGPFHTGSSNDKHNIGQDADGNKINSLHICTNAYFWQDETHDAPLCFEDEFAHIPHFPKPGQMTRHRYSSPVHLEYDPQGFLTHGFIPGSGETRQGQWKWRAQVPFYFRETTTTDPEEPPPDPDEDGNDVATGRAGGPRGGSHGGSHGGGNRQNRTMTMMDGNKVLTGRAAGGFVEESIRGEESASSKIDCGSPQQRIPTSAERRGHGTTGSMFSANRAESIGGIGARGRTRVRKTNFVRPRQRNSDPSEGYIASDSETAMPVWLARPQMIKPDRVDLRRTFKIKPDDFKESLKTPITGRIEAFGAQGGVNKAGDEVGGTPWAYTEAPGRFPKYAGGTSAGGFLLTPPEVDAADEDTDFAPSDTTLSRTYFAAVPGAFFAGGLPDLANGEIVKGVRWGVDTSGELAYEHIDATGATITELIRYKSSEVVVNEPGTALIDFRVEGSGQPDTLVAKGSSGRVGVRVNAPVSVLDVNGSFGTAITTVSVTGTLNETHQTVLVDASLGAVTINLPGILPLPGIVGRHYNVKKIDSSANAVTISPAGIETVDGAASLVLAVQNQSATIQAAAAGWFII